jgi:hypothetical protein
VRTQDDDPIAFLADFFQIVVTQRDAEFDALREIPINILISLVVQVPGEQRRRYLLTSGHGLNDEAGFHGRGFRRRSGGEAEQ